MQRKAPRNRLILLGFVLGLFGLLAPSPARAETVSESPLVVVAEAAAPANVVAVLGSSVGSDSVLTGVEMEISDDFGVALEDSDELLRPESQHRTGVIDYVAVELKVWSLVVPKRHPSTPSPLLV